MVCSRTFCIKYLFVKFWQMIIYYFVVITNMKEDFQMSKIGKNVGKMVWKVLKSTLSGLLTLAGIVEVLSKKGEK